MHKKNTVFHEDYLIESAHQNEIYLSVSELHFLLALRSSTESVQTSIKLTKKDGLAVLALSISDHVRTLCSWLTYVHLNKLVT
jgi:hypothetical protein